MITLIIMIQEVLESLEHIDDECRILTMNDNTNNNDTGGTGESTEY